MARTIVVYDENDIIGHYEKGMGKVVRKEDVGDLTVEVLFFGNDKPAFEKPQKIYLMKDVQGHIKGRTLRVYMTDEEIINWANDNYKAGIHPFKTKVQSVKSLCYMLDCKVNSWHVINTKFDRLPERLQNLLRPVEYKGIVVAIRMGTKNITVVAGEYQSSKENKYGTY